MSDAEKPKKRRFWQLHLSTAVLLMFGAGGFLWLNSFPHRFYPWADMPENYFYQYGWPTVFYTDPEPALVMGIPLGTALDRFIREVGQREVSTLHVVVNVLVALPCLASLAFACEWLIRRREGRKP
jgi:hypothetical protein